MPTNPGDFGDGFKANAELAFPIQPKVEARRGDLALLCPTEGCDTEIVVNADAQFIDELTFRSSCPKCHGRFRKEAHQTTLLPLESGG